MSSVEFKIAWILILRRGASFWVISTPQPDQHPCNRELERRANLRCAATHLRMLGTETRGDSLGRFTDYLQLPNYCVLPMAGGKESFSTYGNVALDFVQASTIWLR